MQLELSIVKKLPGNHDEDETVNRLVLKNINPLHWNEELNLSQTFYVEVENDKSHVFKYIYIYFFQMRTIRVDNIF